MKARRMALPLLMPLAVLAGAQQAEAKAPDVFIKQYKQTCFEDKSCRWTKVVILSNQETILTGPLNNRKARREAKPFALAYVGSDIRLKWGRTTDHYPIKISLRGNYYGRPRDWWRMTVRNVDVTTLRITMVGGYCRYGGLCERS